MALLCAALCPFSLVVTVVCLLVALPWGLRLLPLPSSRWRCKERGRRPPVAGTILHMLKNFRRLYHYQTDLCRRYKTFRMLGLFRSHIYTVDPANVEHILKTNFDNYGKGPFLYDIMKDLLGDGIFAVDGEKWLHQRKVASYEFSTKVLRYSSSGVFKKNAAKLAHVISEAATSRQIFDAQIIQSSKSDSATNITHHMTYDSPFARSLNIPFTVAQKLQDLHMKASMDTIFEVGFGEELDTLSGSREDARAFAKAFDDSSSLTVRRCFDVFWKIKRLLNISSEAALKKNVRVIDDFVYQVIRRKREQMANKRPNDMTKKDDILSRFLMASEVGTETGNDKFLRDITLSFILAGRDTTASTLSWFLYMLCKHPTVQDKVAQEVRQVTETSNNVAVGDFIHNLTEHALNRMHYLHATLTETLRLYPVVPTDSKFCFSDDILPDGFIVKRGDLVDYQPYPMGRMEAVWGEDAEAFRPERWLNEDGAFQPESPFKFTAFQAGPRICLGKEFAYRQMKIFAATLLHRFVFKLGDEQKMVNYKTMLTLHIDGGLHLCAYHR